MRRAGDRLRKIAGMMDKYATLSSMLQELTMGKLAIAKGKPGKPTDLASLLAQTGEGTCAACNGLEGVWGRRG